MLLGHRGGRIAPPGAYRQGRSLGSLSPPSVPTSERPLPLAQALTQRFHNNGSHGGHNGGLQQFAKFDENIEYSVLMPGGELLS